MDTFAHRFHVALSTRGMTAAELSRKTGITEAAISNYRSGKYEPKQHYLEAIAIALDVSIPWLMGADLPMLRFNEQYRPTVILEEEVNVPVVAEVAAGFDKMPLSNFEYEKFSVPRSYVRGHEDDCFMIVVKGDSMYPLYIDGDHVLSRRSSALDYSGQIGIVQDGEAATIKKVEFGKEWIRLVPVNPAYAPRMIRGSDLEQVRIIGIPILLLRDIEQ